MLAVFLPAILSRLASLKSCCAPTRSPLTRRALPRPLVLQDLDLLAGLFEPAVSFDFLD
jgi:hypothetical protein